jgi:hypothetical protein
MEECRSCFQIGWAFEHDFWILHEKRIYMI